jgi:hypothetical protein
MTDRKILPDTDTVRTLLRPRVARFRRKYWIKAATMSGPVIRQANQRGIIALTFTA